MIRLAEVGCLPDSYTGVHTRRETRPKNETISLAKWYRTRLRHSLTSGGSDANDGWNGDWGVGSWIAMNLVMLLFWGGLIVLVVWLVRSSRDDSAADRLIDPTEGGEQLLAERFARREIGEKEFIRPHDLLHRR